MYSQFACPAFVSGSHCLGSFGGGRVGQEDRHSVDGVDDDHCQGHAGDFLCTQVSDHRRVNGEKEGLCDRCAQGRDGERQDLSGEAWFFRHHRGAVTCLF